MRIVYLTAGAGPMRCGACALDVNLIRGLLARGHQVQVLSLYIPLQAEDRTSLPRIRIFLGGINAYLQQYSAIFRRTPAFVDRLLDNPLLLNWVSKFALSTRAENLGPMTVSVLAGREGRQRKELLKLLRFLSSGPRPDLVMITNSMLSAIAAEVNLQLGLPVVCGLQGEEHFIAEMGEPYRSQAFELIRQNARAVELFVTTYEAYAAKMAEFLRVPPSRVATIRAGIDAKAYENPAPRLRNPFTIGYLSNITPSKGLDLLVEALQQVVDEGHRDVLLRVAGRVLDRRYWKQIVRRLAGSALSSRFEYLGEVNFAGKVDFLRRCSVFSVPSRLTQVRGIAAMEALAAGVPVVVPSAGVFPEMISLTGGGITVPVEDADSLTQAILRLKAQPEEADRMGRAGAERIARHYALDRMVDETLRAYADTIAARSSRTDPGASPSRPFYQSQRS